MSQPLAEASHMRTCIIMLLVLCLVRALPGRAATNEYSTLDGLPWHELDQAASAQWDALAARVRAEVATNIVATREAAEVCDTLLKRIENTRDPLDNLTGYRAVLGMPQVANTLYERARRLFWKRDYARATALFTFLTDPANGSGFVRGNAYYFLGKAQREYYHNNIAAFTNYLHTPQHGACLVFIAFAYLEAAKTLENMGQTDNALGLLAVDVPCIDYEDVYVDRHWSAAKLWLGRGNAMRAMRHFQAALAMRPACSNDLAELFSAFPEYYQTEWHMAATNPLDRAEADDTIITALTNSVSTPDDLLFMTALEHEWPTPQAVPLAIATNRVLNNNVFPVRRRNLPISVSPHVRGTQ